MFGNQIETRLEVLKQTSLAEEKYAKNGIQKNVHVVVKNTGFSVVLVMSPAHIPEYDFRRLSIESTLLYDADDEKPVDFVKHKPIEWKARPNETGDECNVEIRIKVLTSQLEDMFFQIRFRALDSLTKTPIPNLITYSEPIKVISKPDQIKKKPHKAKKRNISEIVIDSLQRIEDSQTEHLRLLSQLQTKIQRTSSEISSQISSSRPSGIPEGLSMGAFSDDFDKSFSYFMSAFNSLQAEERPTKIRKLIRTISAREIDQLAEMLDMFWAEGQLRIHHHHAQQQSQQIPHALPPPPSSHHHMQHPQSQSQILPMPPPSIQLQLPKQLTAHLQGHFIYPAASSSSLGDPQQIQQQLQVLQAPHSHSSIGDLVCTGDDCPHRKELTRIDEFYKDFLSSTYLTTEATPDN
jgi:hypothetical protein